MLYCLNQAKIHFLTQLSATPIFYHTKKDTYYLSEPVKAVLSVRPKSV